MKRLLCLLALLCASPAAATTLSKIPASQIGETVTTIPGKASSGSSLLDAVVETTIALNNNGTLKTAANVAALTIPLIAKRAIPALGAAYALGFAVDCAFDLVKAYDNNWLNESPALKNVVDATFPSTQLPPQGAVINSSAYGCSSAKAYVNSVSTSACSQLSNTTDLCSGTNPMIATIHQSCDGGTTPNTGYVWAKRTTMFLLPSVAAITWSPSGAPTTLTPEQAQALGQAIVDAFASNPAVKNAIDSLAVAHPDVVTTPTPITQQDINNWATTNNYNINQTYIDYLTNLKNTYEGDSTWIDQEIAKAQAEQEKEQTEDTEDTYDPITTSAFDPPYNPGEFDIPARFTTFLSNVKSSGLFSFSTSFFNSLPSGGSPLLTIEGGQTFGTHTFDFSQSLGGGLTILKSVLLAVFGFLSIRAVIMKR